MSQGNVGTYDDYIAVLQLPALLAAETSTIRVNNKLNEADGVIEELNLLTNQTQDSLSEMNIAKDLAYETVTHPPVIINKYWHLWNHETNQYDTTYVKAEGDDAYQVWLDAGNTGTVEDYLADIKGDSFLYSDFLPEQLEALKVKGDPFLYEDFTPAQIAELQRPATDAAGSIALLEGEIEGEEALRVTAETTRVLNEQGRVEAEGIRQQNETTRGNAEDDRVEAEALRLSAEITRGQNEQTRITAEGLRATAEVTRQTNTATAITNANNAATNANTKAGLADTAATNANAKATLANDAAILANQKAGLANTAATNADNARLAIQTDLALKEATANKQNSLATDGTGTKFPTVDAVNAGLGNSGIRALFVARGAVYNSSTGFYELNGLTDITEAQMANIYNYTSQSVFQTIQDEMLVNSPIRTTYNRPFNGAVGGTSMKFTYIGSQIEVYKCSIVVSNTASCFRGCLSLKTVDYIYIGSITNPVFLADMFNNCPALVTCNLRYLKVNFSVQWSPLLSLESLQYLIQYRANGTTPITITVHPTVFAKLTDNTNYPTWYAVNQNALTNYITFASA